MKTNIFGLAAIFLITTACGSSIPPAPSQSGLETVVAATIQALTSVAPATPTAPSGTTIAVNNISFIIPTALGSGAQAGTVEAVPPSDGMPWWEVAPTYNNYFIQNYPLTGTFHKPAIYVYPVDEYIQVNADVESVVNNLRTILTAPGQSLPEKLPFLPTFNAAQVFYSNANMVAFQSGSGIRYITQYDQGPLPINNNEVFYTFQGLTADGKYYIAAIMPINFPTLVADGDPNSVIPAGGIPFVWDPANFEAIPAYIDSVKQNLNAGDPNAFNPSLPMLDALMQSISIH